MQTAPGECVGGRLFRIARLTMAPIAASTLAETGAGARAVWSRTRYSVDFEPGITSVAVTNRQLAGDVVVGLVP